MTPEEHNSQENSQEQASDETTSTVTPSEPEPAFGWTSYAERVNGRFAMIGFAALLVIELLTHQSFFEWLGL